MLFSNRSIDIQHHAQDDQLEVHFEGRRYVSSILDPRKKSLRLASGGAGDNVISQMPGRVISILVAVGEAVEKGQIVATVEAMKMENPLKAPREGVVESIEVAPGDLLEAKGVVLCLQAL